jgi:cytochrome c-type biogenesis protein CcmH
MIIFWILAAGLAALALLFLVPPLLRATATSQAPDEDSLNLQVFQHRLSELDGDLAAGNLDQAQYEAARHDLERELLYDLDKSDGAGTRAEKRRATPAPLLAVALAVLVPAGALLAYMQLGDREIIPRIEAAARGAPSAVPAGHGGTETPPLDVLVQRLADRLAEDPSNLEGWVMLARTYIATDQPAKALEAMERAYALAPKEANVVIAYAEAVATNQGNRLAGRPAELIRSALEIDPANPSARWLSGMLAYQEERFDDAANTWQSILDEMDPADQEAVQMRQMVEEARGRATGAPAPEQIAGDPQAKDSAVAAVAPPAEPLAAESQPVEARPPEAPVPDARVQVSVQLDAALAAQTSPGDTVFVFARASAGPPMPLAVQRFTVADLPVSVTLDDTMAMNPAMRLSTFPQVIVGARVSKSGQAMPQPGDLEGLVGPVDSVASAPVSVTIDQVRP